MRRTNSPHDLWKKVAIGGEDDCWYWQGNKRSGYGAFVADYERHDAHVWAYILTYGAVPDGLEVGHLCNNRPCCNPKHLKAMTSSENLLMRPRIIQCRNGHALTTNNTYVNPATGARRCRNCRRAYKRWWNNV